MRGKVAKMLRKIAKYRDRAHLHPSLSEREIYKFLKKTYKRKRS